MSAGKILVVVGGFPTATTTFIRDEIQGLLDRGFSVHVLAEFKPQEIDPCTEEFVAQMGVSVTYLNWRESPLDWKGVFCGRKWHEITARKTFGWRLHLQRFRFFQECASIAAIADSDLIHCHFAGVGLSVGFGLSVLLEKPLTVIAHDSHLLNYPPNNLLRLQKHAKRVYCVSESWQQAFRKHTGSDQNLVTLRNGVRVPSVATADFALRRAKGGPVRLLAASSLTKHKRVADLLDAVSILKDRGVSVHLDVCGDGPCRAILEQQREILKLTDSVTFHGFEDHPSVIRRMGEADIFVHASQRESFGLVIAEAMAMTIPVVCVASRGPSEILAGGEFGSLVPASDPAAIAASIESLLEDPTRTTEIVELAHARIKQCFNQERRLDRLSADLTEIIKNARRGESE